MFNFFSARSKIHITPTNNRVSTIGIKYKLLTISMLIPLIAHMNEAVVRPVTLLSDFTMAPAHKKPIPVAICPIILVGSIVGYFSAR